MILGALVVIFAPIIIALVHLLPNPETLPSAIDTAFTNIAPYFVKANYFFPVDTLFQILALSLGLEASILAFKFGNWAYDKIRGAG